MNPDKNLLTYIDDSPIHGKGLFARLAISQGQIIGWIESVPSRKNGPYVLWLDGKQGVEVQCCLRYINHADEPNACYYDDGSVMALRDIAVGEEITHDYEGASG